MLKVLLGLLVFLLVFISLLVLRFRDKLDKIKTPRTGEKRETTNKSFWLAKLFGFLLSLIPFIYLGILSIWLKVGLVGDKAPALVVAYFVLVAIIIFASKTQVKPILWVISLVCAFVFVVSLFLPRKQPDSYQLELARIEQNLAELDTYTQPTQLVRLREQVKKRAEKARKHKNPDLLAQLQGDLTKLAEIRDLEEKRAVFVAISKRSITQVLAYKKDWVKVADVHTGEILRVLAQVDPENPPRLSYLGSPLLQKIPNIFGYSKKQLRGWPAIVCDQFKGFDIDRPRFGELVFMVLDENQSGVISEKHLPASYIRHNPRNDWWYDPNQEEFFFVGAQGRSVWAIIADRNPYNPTFARAYDDNRGVIFLGHKIYNSQ